MPCVNAPLCAPVLLLPLRISASCALAPLFVPPAMLQRSRVPLYPSLSSCCRASEANWQAELRTVLAAIGCPEAEALEQTGDFECVAARGRPHNRACPSHLPVPPARPACPSRLSLPPYTPHVNGRHVPVREKLRILHSLVEYRFAEAADMQAGGRALDSLRVSRDCNAPSRGRQAFVAAASTPFPWLRTWMPTTCASFRLARTTMASTTFTFRACASTKRRRQQRLHRQRPGASPEPTKCGWPIYPTVFSPLVPSLKMTHMSLARIFVPARSSSQRRASASQASTSPAVGEWSLVCDCYDDWKELADNLRRASKVGPLLPVAAARPRACHGNCLTLVCPLPSSALASG